LSDVQDVINVKRKMKSVIVYLNGLIIFYSILNYQLEQITRRALAMSPHTYH